jgi:hypothetical protein
MALSTLNASLPALEDLIAFNPRPPSPPPPRSPRTPKTPKKKIGSRLTRDIRRDILFLRELNDYDNDEVKYTYEKITILLSHYYKRKVTQRAVQYIINTEKATPTKEGRGKKPTLIVELVDEIKIFIIYSRSGRQAIYIQLRELFDVSSSTVKYTLRKRGYSRRITLRKPPISEKNRLARLA